jgi:integrase
MGTIYKRKWKDKDGNLVEGEVYWIKYYRHGKPYRESSKSEKITEVRRLLKKREGEIAEGKFPGIYFDKVTFNELAEDFLTDYRINGRDTVSKAERSVKYLKEAFGGMRATDITTAKVKTYIDDRMNKGLSNASINRELAALKRMFHLAMECTPPKVNLIPYIPMLKESNVRKGFFESHEHLALLNALPGYLRPIVSLAYHSGWRKEEILSRTIDKVDMNEYAIRLDPGETKNEEGRTYYMNDEVKEEIRTALENRNPACPYLFQRDGQQIKDFRAAWGSACIAAGLYEMVRDEKGNETKVASKLFHDYRRSAVRDMVRSGIPERVAMKISGHKTRSVFDRYNIVSDQDLKEAARKKQAYHEKQSKVVIPFKRAQNE